MKPRILILTLVLATFLFPTLSRADTGMSILQGTADDSELFGIAIFEDTEEGLQVTADFIGATPGKHSLLIHEQGSCEERGDSAGAQLYEVGVIETNEESAGSLETNLSELTIAAGEKSIANRAIILQQDGTENRIGCGIIVGTAE